MSTKKSKRLNRKADPKESLIRKLSKSLHVTQNKTLSGSKLSSPRANMKHLSSKIVRMSKSKLFGRSCQRGVADKLRAGKHGGLDYIGDMSVMALMRPFPPFKLSIIVGVGKRSSESKHRARSCEKEVSFNNGTVRLRAAPGSERVKLGKESFHLANVIGMMLNKDLKQIQLEVLFDDKTSEKDEYGVYKNSFIVRYIFTFSSEAQAQEIAHCLVAEIDNCAIIADFGLGHMEQKENVQPHCIEALLRKRVDMLLITRESKSNFLHFAIDKLVEHLEKQKQVDEVKLWNDFKKEILEDDYEDQSGLEESQKVRLNELCDSKFKTIKQKCKHSLSLKSIDEAKELNEKEMITSSYYGKLYQTNSFESA